MRAQLALSIIIFLTLSHVKLFAQSKSVLPGSVKGVLRDTARNYVLKSATVSVYREADSSLINYQVSNNYGEFNFKNLPLSTSMYIEVSNVGYQTLRQQFTIPAGNHLLDLKTLVIKPQDINLKEVVVTIPPIRMNGDTLEFNAAAFKLDSNAVVEDLLKKIPNITLWGDGQITVNGREVKSLLVNGKTFFGGDPKIATQNIAKNALEKIQVYNVNENQDKPSDSVLHMNLKLKKGKDIGYFGKIGGGYGTTNRFEGDASFNMFSPKMQLAFVAAGNNINKNASNIQNLLVNSTFKGAGTAMDYQPDFSASGINRTNTGGIDFKYSFIPNSSYNNKKDFKSSYFIQHRNYENLTQSETTSLLNGGNRIVDVKDNTNKTTNTSQTVTSEFDFADQLQTLRILQTVAINNGLSNVNSIRSSENDQNELTSTNKAFDQRDYRNNRLTLSANYRLNRNYLKQNAKFNGLTANYRLNLVDDESDRSNLTEFRSFVNAATSRNFNRNYQTKTNSLQQQLDFEFLNLKSNLFGKAKLGGINFSIVNQLIMNSANDRNNVEDLNAQNGGYVQNPYLSNQIRATLIDEAPGISFIKIISKALSNRYHKSYTFRASAKHKFISQNFDSQKGIQNIQRHYNRFAPTASITYNNSQYGEFTKFFVLNFNTNLILPTIDELAPLVDSTEVYTLRRGNLKLREATDRVFSLQFNHSTQANKNTFSYNIYVSGGLTNNAITDSILIDAQNRQTIFAINADGNKYMNLNTTLNKAYKFKTGELKLILNAGARISKTPGYINGAFSFAESRNLNGSVTANYSFKSVFAVEYRQSISDYKSKQLSFNNTYRGTNLKSMLSAIYNVNKKFSLNSNLTYNTSKIQGREDVNFTLWNASATYRFLKGNNGELKFSALDMLRQNNSVINYGSGNSFTIGTQNVLQQYFMTTLSYYPRQFGKNTAKK